MTWKLCLALVLLCLPSHAAWSLVDHKSIASTSLTATVTGLNCTGADLVVVTVSDFADPTAGTVTSSPANTFTHLLSAGGAAKGVALWYVSAASVSGSMSVSYTGAFPTVLVQCWSGSATSPFDQQGIAGPGASIQPSITPGVNGELVITGYYSEDSGGPYTVTGGGGYTSLDAILQGTSMGGAMAYLVQSTAALTNPTWASSSSASLASIASFKIATGGGVSVQRHHSGTFQ